MIVKTLQTVEEFKAFEPAWRNLHANSPEGSLYNSFDYTWVWWATFHSLGQLSIYVVKDKLGNVAAIAPMYKTRSPMMRLFTLNTLRFIGRGSDVTPVDLNVLFCADKLDAEAAGKLLISTWQQTEDIQRLLFEELPEQSRFFAMVQQHVPYLVEHTQIRWVAELPDTWEKFTASLSRNTRKRIKHRRNRLYSKETLSMQLCTKQQQMKEALNALITLHKERRHSKGDSAAFSTTDYIQFHQSLLSQSAEKNAIRFVTLRDGDDIVGVEYMYLSNGTLLFNQTGFKPEYEPYSPGHNMMVFAIENAIEQGIQTMDLLHGNYQYKQSYASDSITTLTVSSYRSITHRLVAHLLQKAKVMKSQT